ncbi:hypothetical protein SDC9_188935 [bioreactor metagenome]|uniref:Uncharacterized protein n=1 Tax=bioreactor metagenome TaxID=1076179 RepID=A0A645HT56_9ZZZZ
MGYSSTFTNESLSELHNRIENNTEVLGNSILEEIKTNTGQINETIISNKDEITKEFRQIHKEALGYPPALVLLKK